MEECMTGSGATIPFMITNAMKAALRKRGFSDPDIEGMTPEGAYKALLVADPNEVRDFVTALVTLATASLGGHPTPGALQVCRLHPSNGRMVTARHRLDDVDGMVSAALTASENGQNAYIEGRLVNFSLRGAKRGELEDTVCVFALTIDSDADRDAAWTPPPGTRPTIVVQTSPGVPGNHHYWFFLKKAIHPQQAQQLGERIRRATGADSDSGNPVQPYRIGGTVSYPNKAKIARGRIVTWTQVIAYDLTALWTPEEIEKAFPAIGSTKGNGSGNGASAGAGTRTNDAADESLAGEGLMRVIREGVPDDSKARSDVFYDVVEALKWGGFTPNAVTKLLGRYPDGIARKYVQQGGLRRLERAVEQAYDKIPLSDAPPSSAPASPPDPVPAPSAPNSRAAPSASTGPTILPPPLPQPLVDAHATFQRWLGATYEMDVFDATAAAGAAEKLGGDPLWLMVISGSGNAKTETVQSLSGAGAIVTSTISSEGALLSATTRSHGATGGLLIKIGPCGLLVIKDFTTILAMDSKIRGTVLAALREIHDGRWERNVGFAGARTLTWAGRIVLVAACTTAWDEARKAVEAMGDRFVLVRADSTTGRMESARRAIENTGREDVMRAELAKAMGGLVASADMNVRQLTSDEKDTLTKLANIVTWARSGVERDYHGAVINAHAPEMPTRFSKQLAQVARGALSLGIPTASAMQLATRCARDSLEPLRRDLLLDVAANPNTNPDEVHRRIIRPLTTVKNNLIALHTLRLLVCDERDELRGNRVFSVPYYHLAPELDRAVLLSM
jgi:hypothetical protein